jgi:hypothetical protein
LCSVSIKLISVQSLLNHFSPVNVSNKHEHFIIIYVKKFDKDCDKTHSQIGCIMVCYFHGRVVIKKLDYLMLHCSLGKHFQTCSSMASLTLMYWSADEEKEVVELHVNSMIGCVE